MSGGKMTAAAVTGPAKQPLPASSVPASKPSVFCGFSIALVGLVFLLGFAFTIYLHLL